MDTDANIMDFLPQHCGTLAIQLDRHQIRRKLHHVGFQPQLPERVGGLQPQQPAANHHPAFCAAGAGGNTVQVIEGAVDETALQIVTRNRRNEGIRAGRQHQFIPMGFMPAGITYHPRFAVNGRNRLRQPQFDAVPGEEIAVHQRQRLRATAGEIF